MVAGGRDRNAVDYPRCETMAFHVFNREAGSIPRERMEGFPSRRDPEPFDVRAPHRGYQPSASTPGCHPESLRDASRFASL